MSILNNPTELEEPYCLCDDSPSLECPLHCEDAKELLASVLEAMKGITL